METGFPPGYSYVGWFTGLVPSMDLIHPSACNWGVRSLLLPPHNPLLIAPLRSGDREFGFRHGDARRLFGTVNLLAVSTAQSL